MVPVLDLPIPAAAVLASAPVVLFLVILIVFGTLRAYKTAEGVLGPAAGDETTDEHPNVIDWVAYTTASSPNWIKGLLGFSYVLYLSVFAFEAWYFLVPLPFEPDPVPGRWFFVATGSVEAVIVFVFITQFWIDRYRRWFKPVLPNKRLKRDPLGGLYRLVPKIVGPTSDVVRIRVALEANGQDLALVQERSLRDTVSSIHHGAIRRQDDWMTEIGLLNKTHVLHHLSPRWLLVITSPRLIKFAEVGEQNPSAWQVRRESHQPVDVPSQ